MLNAIFSLLKYRQNCGNSDCPKKTEIEIVPQ